MMTIVETSIGVFVSFSPVKTAGLSAFRRGVATPDEKVEREVAVITLIRQYTDIPVPAVEAWGLPHENALGLGPFITSQFVEGESLGRILQDPEAEDRSMADNIEDSVIEKVYQQIAKFQLQLASLEFPHIGGLSSSMQRDNESEIISVNKRPLKTRGQSILSLDDVDVLCKCILRTYCEGELT
jgi:hypothetical protein